MPSLQSGNVDNFLPLFGKKNDSLTFLYSMVLYFDLRKEDSLIIVNVVISAILSLSLTRLLAILGSTLTPTEWAWFFVSLWAILELSDIANALRTIKNALYDVRVQVMTKPELPLKVELKKDMR